MAEYDELVKRLREVAEEVDGDYDVDPYNAEQRCLAILQAADAIDAMIFVVREQKAALDKFPRWIPVTERLPGTGEIVLVYGKRGGIYTAEHNRSARWPGSFWKLNSKSHYCEPTHWMPLPEPPEEES